jgi:molybdate transport system substrate-binding protein
VSVYSPRPDLARRFIEFLLSPEGQAIYRKHGYFMTPEEAFRYVGEEKPVGGEYPVPPDWLRSR